MSEQENLDLEVGKDGQADESNQLKRELLTILTQKQNLKIISILLDTNLNNPLTNKDYNPDLFGIRNLCNYTNGLTFSNLSKLLSTQEGRNQLAEIINRKENLEFKQNWIELISRASIIEKSNYGTNFYENILQLIQQN